MSFHKFTSIAGTADSDQAAKFKVYVFRGHWKLDAALRYARRAKMLGTVTVQHCVADCSGHGRSGHDGRWVIDAAGAVTKIENWREGGRVSRAAESRP